MKKIYIADEVTIFDLIYTIWGWAFFVIVNSIQIFVLPVIYVLTFLFDKDKKVVIYTIKVFCQIFYFLNFFQKTTVERNKLKSPKKGERRIYIVNHASMFDTILMYLLPGPIVSIMKEAYAKIPVIGWLSVMSGNLILMEDDTSSNVNVYMKMVEKLERGVPIIIFPEGTKSKDSKIGKFYNGAFKIALETKADIVPVAFDTWNVIRPNYFWIRDVKHNIRILDTVKYEDFKDLSYKEVAKNIRIKIIEGLLEVRDKRRGKTKAYYRRSQKYIDIDNEMREELLLLKSNKKKESVIGAK
jgi:1-acyl-sn-glycerol-3-phosphate acyltransferase